MTEYKDINNNPRNNMPYVIAGLLVLAVILGFMFMDRDYDRDISRTAPAAGEISSDNSTPPPGIQ
jgi:hypothetical protein